MISAIQRIVLGALGGFSRHAVGHGWKIILPKIFPDYISLGFLGNVTVGSILGFLAPVLWIYIGLPPLTGTLELVEMTMAFLVGGLGAKAIEKLFEKASSKLGSGQPAGFHALRKTLPFTKTHKAIEDFARAIELELEGVGGGSPERVKTLKTLFVANSLKLQQAAALRYPDGISPIEMLEEMKRGTIIGRAQISSRSKCYVTK